MYVHKLEIQGVHLTVDGESITVETSAPLTEIQRQFIKIHKAELITELKGQMSNVINLIPFLENCCNGYNTNTVEVKQSLFSKENIQDIQAGEISEKTVKAHIKLWVSEGKKNYVEHSEKNNFGD